MKKILFVVFLCSFLVFNVEALSDDLTINKYHYYVCDNDNILYPLYNIIKEDKHYYFLDQNLNYNFDFRNYEEINFASSPYHDKVRDFTSFRYLFNDLNGFNDYYEPFVSLMIYRFLSGNDNLFLCSETKDIINLDTIYDDNYHLIKDLINGPIFGTNIRMVPNKDQDLIDPHLTYYEITGLDNFNAQMIDDETIRINEDKGTYELHFIRSDYNAEGLLYTDNSHYLLQEGGYSYSDFLVTITIDDPLLIINNYSEEITDFTSLCFTLKNETSEYNFCADEDGIARIQVPTGVYELVLPDIGLNNNYVKNNIALWDVERVVNIEWGEDIIANLDDTIEFIPSNTLELAGIITVIIVSIGCIILVKKLS